MTYTPGRKKEMRRRNEKQYRLDGKEHKKLLYDLITSPKKRA